MPERFVGGIYGLYDYIPQTWAKYAKYITYNLSQPEKSMALLAPLAKEAGGLGICKGPNTKAVFTSKEDEHYVKILEVLKRYQKYPHTHWGYYGTKGYYGSPGYKPNPLYFEIMKQYGILPKDFDPEKDPYDVFEIDRRYWESHWHQPQQDTAATQ